MWSGLIAHRAAQAQDPDALVDINAVLDADTSVRGHFFIFIIVIAMNVEYRHGGKCCQKGKVAGVQISAGDNQVNSLKFAFFKIIPQGSGFLIRNRQYPHKPFILPFF